MCSFSFAQLPTGIDPSTVSKADLEKYGVSESDLKRALQQYGSQDQQSKKSNPSPKQEQEKEVEKEKKVVPKKAEDKPSEKRDHGVYGKSFFDGKLALYEKATHVKPSGDYVLGSGDEISISIWGFSEFNASFTIDENGAISPSLVGKIYLKGVSLEKAKEIIKYRFGKVYDLKNSQASIELNYAKVIRVNVAGEVNNPGTYSVSALNSAFSILSQAGGLNEIGSLRSIKIFRDGKLVNTLDVYKYMQSPVSNNDFYLLDNDYVVVESVKRRVRISGPVLRPMTYELLQEEDLEDLIGLAGGFRPDAYKQIVQITRIKDDQEVLLEFNLLSDQGKINPIALEDGDLVHILQVPDELQGYVQISGAINISGKYALEDTLSLSELVSKAGGLDKQARMDKAFVLRLNEDMTKTRIQIDLRTALFEQENDFILQEFDQVKILSKKEYIDQFEIRILGEVRNPQNLEFSERMTLQDAILLSGGLKFSAEETRIQISRVMNSGSNDSSFLQRTVIEEFDLKGNLERSQNIILQPMDIIFIRRNPEFETQQNVVIQGEVVFPGMYSLKTKGETLKELIERAGGVTDWAFLEGATIERGREDVKFMVLDLYALMKEGKDEYNYILQAGDKIVVPRTENVVALSGALDYPKIQEVRTVHVPFIKGKSAKYYINKFGGGFAEDAKKKKTIVITPGGYVKRTKSILWIKFYPKVKMGDSVQTFYKKEKVKEKKETDPIDWNRAIENTTIKLTGVLTLWVLINNAFN